MDHLKAAEELPSIPSRLERLLEAKIPSGMTALLIAASMKDYFLVELLIGAGADVKAVDKNKDTALILASKDSSSNACIPPIDLLSPNLVQVLHL